MSTKNKNVEISKTLLKDDMTMPSDDFFNLIMKSQVCFKKNC
jgi:hypothetical protein